MRTKIPQKVPTTTVYLRNGFTAVRIGGQKEMVLTVIASVLMTAIGIVARVGDTDNPRNSVGLWLNCCKILRPDADALARVVGKSVLAVYSDV